MSKICNGCGTEKSPASVPYVVHESAMARAERQTKSLVWVIVLLIVLLVGSNCAWLWYNSQFETVIETTETIFEDVAQESAEGSNNIMLCLTNLIKDDKIPLWKHIIFYQIVIARFFVDFALPN